MIQDRQAAEDIVQDAFCGLHRRWGNLHDSERALAHITSAVLNGCRSEFRRRKASRGQAADPPAWSAESAAMASEERREVLRALGKLPGRQREALVLRYYWQVRFFLGKLSEAGSLTSVRPLPGRRWRRERRRAGRRDGCPAKLERLEVLRGGRDPVPLGPSGQLGYDLAVARGAVSGGALVSWEGGATVSAFMVRPPQGALSPAGRLAYVQMSHDAASGNLTERSLATGQP